VDLGKWLVYKFGNMFIFEELRSSTNGFMAQPVADYKEKNISLNLTASN